MALAAGAYFEHLKAYVNPSYVVDDGSGGRVVLSEKYFRPNDVRARRRKIALLLPGPGMAFKLDHDGVDIARKKRKQPLFHFLEDTSKPWSKRCDFVVFYVHGQAVRADCIEFKSKSLTAEKIVPQLKAGACWVSSLKRTVENYTGDRHRIRLRKFVFADNDNPGAYLTANGQMIADPSIRYYNFDEVNGQPLATLHNASVQEV